MRKPTALAIAMCCVATALTRIALAEKVALVRPREETGVLADAFNRLQGELRIHHFESEVVNVDVADAPVERLAEIAQRAGALAGIAFVQHGDTASIDIWLLDRVSGKTTMRRLDVGNSNDAASVLAFRTVDLLRISLQEYEPGERPPKEVVGVDPRPIPSAVRKLTAPPAPLVRLRAEAMALYDGPEFGFCYGPAVSVHRAFGPFELGAAFAGPLIGAEFEAGGGSASMRQELALVDTRLALFSGERGRAGVNLSVGAHFLQAEGQAEPPLRSRNGAVFGFAAAAGLHGELFLSRAAALTLSLRGLGLAPGQGVALLSERARLNQPLVAASLGVVVGL
ncbi:MAG: hypothetical protein ACOY0T_18480 [Myxococcota bacterium]